MADQQLVGKVGRVTGRIGPDRIGEVMVPVRGGTEAYHAYSADDEEIAPRVLDPHHTGCRPLTVSGRHPVVVAVAGGAREDGPARNRSRTGTVRGE